MSNLCELLDDDILLDVRMEYKECHEKYEDKNIATIKFKEFVNE